MQEPLISDFGLSERSYSALRRFDEHSWVNIGCALIVLSACTAIAYAAASSESLGAFLLRAFIAGTETAMVGLISVMVIGGSWEYLGALLSRKVRAYTRFKAASREYDAWVLRSRSEYWLAMSGLQFEYELALLFRALGYNAELTPATGDNGVDIVLRHQGKTIIVQCKATQKPAGPNIVRELYGTLIAVGADEAILASVAGCTPGAHAFIRDKPIQVLSLDRILRMQAAVAPARSATGQA